MRVYRPSEPAIALAMLRDIKRIVGGKCVLAPPPDARVGQPNDQAMLDLAISP